MKAWMTGFALLAGLLAGCDLEEARRMNLTRSRVDSIEAQTPRVLWRGSQLAGLSRFLNDPRAPEGWSVEWGDRATFGEPPADWTFAIEAQGYLVWQGSRTFHQRNWTILTGTDLYEPALWQCSLSWGEGSVRRKVSVTCPFVKDWNELTWSSWQDSLRTVHHGDTLSLEFGLEGKIPGKSEEIASDHAGLRIVGDYSVVLQPGQAGRLRWVVLADPGQAAWVDLRWGFLGKSHRFNFRVAP
ncbi:MAG: hypothetical protein RL318_2732 [Fibrobacterota bacterium]|jgi:hypothetical protein